VILILKSFVNTGPMQDKYHQSANVRPVGHMIVIAQLS